MYKFKCKTCGEIHEGICAFGIDKPDSYWDVPKEKIESDIELNTDVCVIANKFYFVRGCLEIPINDLHDKFEFGVWVSLSFESFKTYIKYLEKSERSEVPPMFGWLNTNLTFYGNTLNLKTMVHLRDNFIRPYIEIEQTGNEISIDQRNGIESSKYEEIHNYYIHNKKRST